MFLSQGKEGEEGLAGGTGDVGVRVKTNISHPSTRGFYRTRTRLREGVSFPVWCLVDFKKFSFISSELLVISLRCVVALITEVID